MYVQLSSAGVERNAIIGDDAEKRKKDVPIVQVCVHTHTHTHTQNTDMLHRVPPFVRSSTQVVSLTTNAV